MKCREWSIELVECARAGLKLRREARQHLRECIPCVERWEMECELSARIQSARDVAMIPVRAEERRQAIMNEFASRRQSFANARRWTWVFAAAASILLVLTAAFGLQFGRQETNVTASNAGMNASSGAPGVLEAADDFVPVPFTPPLAAGEFIRVERTELQPIALARMGIYVDASYGGDIPADVAVGEDGLPRAVRIVNGE